MFLQEAKEILIKENQYISALKNVGKRISDTKIGKFTKGIGEDLHPFKKFVKPAAVGTGVIGTAVGITKALRYGDERINKQMTQLVTGGLGTAGAIVGAGVIANILRKRKKCNKIKDKVEREKCFNKLNDKDYKNV